HTRSKRDWSSDVCSSDLLEQIWEISNKLQQPLSSYFVLTQDIVNMMWKISLVGTARGSAACYYTNYLLGIVQINPMDYDLPYYCFFSKERASYSSYNYSY